MTSNFQKSFTIKVKYIYISVQILQRLWISEYSIGETDVLQEGESELFKKFT